MEGVLGKYDPCEPVSSLKPSIQPFHTCDGFDVYDLRAIQSGVDLHSANSLVPVLTQLRLGLARVAGDLNLKMKACPLRELNILFRLGYFLR